MGGGQESEVQDKTSKGRKLSGICGKTSWTEKLEVSIPDRPRGGGVGAGFELGLSLAATSSGRSSLISHD